jgi:Icc protein
MFRRRSLLIRQETQLEKRIIHDHNRDGIDRRGFLTCMAWAGTGVVWTVSEGVLTSRAFGADTKAPASAFSFVQISDSHIGFKRPANPDVNGTLRRAIEKMNALPDAPEFIVHTGDLTHNANPEEFDTLEQLLKEAKAKQVFYVPGEHDVESDQGKMFLERFGHESKGRGWHSFDHRGIHFAGLVNVGGEQDMGKLGPEQLEWLEKDLKGRPASMPVVLFAHVPLWAVYPQWGWTTEDAERGLAYLRRFGSVTVLNGHIHQVLRKVEGQVTFHTAMSTAFPQPAPGSAPAPGPMKIPEAEARRLIGVTQATYLPGQHPLAVVDSTLG